MMGVQRCDILGSGKGSTGKGGRVVVGFLFLASGAIAKRVTDVQDKD